MQMTLNAIYESIAKEKNQEYALVKSVGDCVFKQLLASFKTPQSLILKVRGIGQFYLRHQKLQEYIEQRRDFYFNPENEKSIDSRKHDEEDFYKRKERFENLILRLDDYQRYLEKKREIRLIRNKTQPLIQKEDDSTD